MNLLFPQIVPNCDDVLSFLQLVALKVLQADGSAALNENV